MPVNCSTGSRWSRRRQPSYGPILDKIGYHGQTIFININSKRRTDAIRRLGCFLRSAVSWGDGADEEFHRRTARRTREGVGLHPLYVLGEGWGSSTWCPLTRLPSSKCGPEQRCAFRLDLWPVCAPSRTTGHVPRLVSAASIQSRSPVCCGSSLPPFHPARYSPPTTHR